MSRSSPSMTGGRSSGAVGHVSVAFCLRARIRVRQASPPVSATMSRSPRRISCDVVFASSRGLWPRRSAMIHAGLRYFHDSELTTRIESKVGGPWSPASSAASTIAASMSAAGSIASSRPFAWCRCWPTPMITGVRGSIVTDRTLGAAGEALRIVGGMARIAIGSDHAGFDLKSHFVGLLRDRGHDVIDLGTDSTDVVDYPIFCSAVGRAVRGGDAEVGVVLGGSGQGEQLAANKVRGVRAALCNDLYTARMARAHNDANVLSIGARIVGTGLAEEILATFLTTAFEGGRHARRVAQLTDLEADF